LGATPPTPASEPNTTAPEFYDEPQFTVAGVTQATNSGGHGSDTIVRTTEALARATVSLSTGSESNGTGAKSEPPAAATESSLRDAVLRNPNDAALHHQLGNVEEKLGNPLAAVREYQRAAELDSTEQYLFDWGAELLTHRALEPATEVFTKGNRLFPKSERMLIALGVADYARGSYDRAAQHLADASDLAPGDETPYLFMGKMQSAETAPSEQTLERLARFQHLKPDNTLANYYYAVGLWKAKQSQGASDDAISKQVETLLQKAIQLEPQLGAAHLQFGIVYDQRGDYPHAILAYRKAIEVSPELEEAHYRLAQAYRRTGNIADAQKELRTHEQLSKASRERAQRERNEIQQFVISLK
jgi:tetratricopeptide (TPR) repeat protein